MLDRKHERFIVSVLASGNIWNPWYYVAPTLLSTSGPRIPRQLISEPVHIALPSHGLDLYAKDDELLFVTGDQSEESQFKINPIRHFLTYRGFIDWNLFGPPKSDFDEKEYKSDSKIQFTLLQRNTQHLISIENGELVEYLDVLDKPLFYAMASYLTGCQSSRYFLFEFFKATEFIQRELGGERRLLSALKPHGVTSTKFKELKRLCNDDPLDISRHAPKKGVPFYAVDIAFRDPKSQEIFKKATVLSRLVIDAYLEHRKALKK